MSWKNHQVGGTVFARSQLRLRLSPFNARNRLHPFVLAHGALRTAMNGPGRLTTMQMQIDFSTQAPRQAAEP
jgi:hypothetical protein